MYPDAICGSKEFIDYVRPHVERAMQKTYSDVTRKDNGEDEKTRYCRERMEAAVSILERIIGRDIEDELEREMERMENRAYHRGQNLMMVRRALEEIRTANGHLEERDFSHFQQERAIYRTHYGMQMLRVEEVLEKFWTGE
jgi:hypothetical protein